MAIDLKDLHQGELYQIQASREHLKDNQEMNSFECLSVIQKSTYRKPPYTFIRGSTLCHKMSFLAHLDPANVPWDPGRNRLQSSSSQFFNNDGLIMFYGPEAQLVRFWAQTSIPTSQAFFVPSLVPINASTWTKPPSAIPLTYEYR